MKMLDSLDRLKSWTEYRDYMKESLKLVDGEAPCFVSKDKFEFDLEGKPWKGHVFLAGKKAVLSVKKLKKEGVLFRETTCTRKAKELELGPLQPAKLLKETEKTLIKLRLGYKVKAAPGTGEEGAAGAEAGAADPRRAKNVAALRKMEKDLDRLLTALG